MLPSDQGNASKNPILAFAYEAYDFFNRIPDLMPREVAIMGGSFLEYGLKHLLDSKLPDSSDTIFDKGPLHTMEARAKMARALGYIPKEVLSELLGLGKIRNRFAHEYRLKKFSDVDISKLTKELKLTSEDAAAECFVQFFGCRLEKGSGRGADKNSFLVKDELGLVLLEYKISGRSKPRDLYTNSLKFTWGALYFASIREPH